jgi:flagellar assembly protein FliH
VARINWFTEEARITAMGATQKFLFEECFASSPEFEAEPEEIEVVPPAPTFSEEEIAAAQAKGFAEGRNEGISEMKDGIDQRVATVMECMVEQLGTVETARAESAKSTELRFLSLATAIAKKAVPSVAREHADAVVTQLIQECVHATLIDEMKKKLDTLAAKCGFSGDIIMLPDDDLAEADCRVEWADGGAERSSKAVWEEIEQAIDVHLGHLNGDTTHNQDDAGSPVTATTGVESPEENLNG